MKFECRSCSQTFDVVGSAAGACPRCYSSNVAPAAGGDAPAPGKLPPTIAQPAMPVPFAPVGGMGPASPSGAFGAVPSAPGTGPAGPSFGGPTPVANAFGAPPPAGNAFGAPPASGGAFGTPFGAPPPSGGAFGAAFGAPPPGGFNPYGAPMSAPMGMPGAAPGNTTLAIVLGAFGTLCGCLPLGVAGIVLAVQANGLARQGRLSEAQDKAKSAMICSGIAAGMTVLVVVFWLIDFLAENA